MVRIFICPDWVILELEVTRENMTLTEKEEYELRIKNMQSKIDYLRQQRENLTTYAKKYEPLTDEQIKKASLKAGMQEHYMGFHSGFIRFAKAIEEIHGIK